MANKVEDGHRDDDAERGGENDTENCDPHVSRGIIIGIKFAQHVSTSFLKLAAVQRAPKH